MVTAAKASLWSHKAGIILGYYRMSARFYGCLVLWGCIECAYALNPAKAITQYSTTRWSQEDGLPQDTIRAIAQTTDGFLWIGTDEGLARFDGYDFVPMGKDREQLPSNSISALAAGQDGSLWVGTPYGVTRYSQRQFKTYTVKDGLAANAVSALFVDHAGVLWIVAGGNLSRFDGAQFKNYLRERDIPLRVLRSVWEDPRHVLFLAGTNSVVRFENGRFAAVTDASALEADFPNTVIADRHGNTWITGLKGLVRQSPDGKISRFGRAEGLPYTYGVATVREDRDGNLWVGTDRGLARLEGQRFRMLAEGDEQSGVRCLFEDREGNLWVGTNRGLLRFRDDVFTVFGKQEGLPSDQPNIVFEDRSGDLWGGFADVGLVRFPAGDPSRAVAIGPPGARIYSIRQGRNGDLLVSTTEGLLRWKDGVRLSNFVPPDPQRRKRVFDAIEDSTGRIWLTLPNGLGQLREGEFKTVIPASTPVMPDGAFTTLVEDGDSSLWVGTVQDGLWHVRSEGNRLYTTADGLSGNQVRALRLDRDGTLWIGTFGGGLNAFQNGKIQRFTARYGLLSDNLLDVLDDGADLWLNTTRGICRVSKAQLRDFAAGRMNQLRTVNYGTSDGLRSAQAPPEIGRGVRRSSDGSLWFPTAQGIAVYSPERQTRTHAIPPVYILEMTADGRRVDGPARPVMPPGVNRVELSFAALHLGAPERLRYSYKLDGLDADWVPMGEQRRVIYNNLGRGQYQFRVRAELAGGAPGEAAYEFELLPHYYETAWFRSLCAALVAILGWFAYRLRIGQIRSRFAAVLKERLRLAREIHDTLAQAFVGISAQLDALETCVPEDLRPAHRHLDLARRMSQHSLTEARRSIMDLRSSALHSRDLSAALKSGANSWAAGANVDVEVEVAGQLRSLPDEVEQNLLRIAQEAVANSLKHAAASKITVRLQRDGSRLKLNVTDDGRGFEPDDAFTGTGGHFGLIGIRERAERIGGELRLDSHPGKGTEVEVTLPLV